MNWYKACNILVVQDCSLCYSPLHGDMTWSPTTFTWYLYIPSYTVFVSAWHYRGTLGWPLSHGQTVSSTQQGVTGADAAKESASQHARWWSWGDAHRSISCSMLSWCFQFLFPWCPSLCCKTHKRTHTHTLILKGLECIADRVRVRFEAQLYVDQWVASSKYLRGELGEINADLLEWPLSHASVSERRWQNYVIFDRKQTFPCYVVWCTLWGSIGGNFQECRVYLTSWKNAIVCLRLSGSFNRQEATDWPESELCILLVLLERWPIVIQFFCAGSSLSHGTVIAVN